LCRPNWALAHTWHVALAIAGSLISVASPIAGLAILGVALASVTADALTGLSPGRRLTPEHASQNVVAVTAHTDDQRTRTAHTDTPRTRLILTANYDAGHVGLAYRDAFRKPSAFLREQLHGITPGWLGWLVLAIAWLIAIGILRVEGHSAQPIGAIQLPPTVALVLAFALLLELATADWGPAAGDNATGVAAVLALAHALDAAPPAHLDVELVLTGAGDGEQIGLRRYLRKHRGERTAANTVVVGIASCAGGAPRWWRSDGVLVPLRFARPLRELATSIADDEQHLAAAPHSGRGGSPAFPARQGRFAGLGAGIPAITIGCLDDHGLAPHSHHPDDTPEAVDPSALEAAIQLALLLIDGIDSAVADNQGRPSPTPA
jgi:hypothetical protein